MWPATAVELETLQTRLASRAISEPPWTPPTNRPLLIGGVFVATPRIPEPYSEPGWAAAVVLDGSQVVDEAVCEDVFEASYESGLLALR